MIYRDDIQNQVRWKQVEITFRACLEENGLMDSHALGCFLNAESTLRPFLEFVFQAATISSAFRGQDCSSWEE